MKREPYLVVVFSSTEDAFIFEDMAGDRIRGRIIPLPSEISQGCGLAWKGVPEERERIEDLLTEGKFKECRVVLLGDLS